VNTSANVEEVYPLFRLSYTEENCNSWESGAHHATRTAVFVVMFAAWFAIHVLGWTVYLLNPSFLTSWEKVFKDVDASLAKVVQTAERELEYEDQNKVYKSA